MFNRTVLTIVATFAVASGTFAFVANVTNHLVDQKDKAFSQDKIKVRLGDTIEFKNSDTVVHNVFSNTAGLEFDLRTQQPGKSSTVTFDKPGTCEVRCAIHPKMKLTVEVEK
jgi:plastocyanin